MIAPYGKDSQNQPHLPNKTQQKVLDWVDAVRAGKAKTTGIPCLYLQGGVGSGKTRGLLAPVTEVLTQIANLRVLWGRQDYNDLRLSAMETFFEVMPPELIIDKDTQEHRWVIGQDNKQKAQIFFRGLKDLSGLGSQEFGIAVITEVHEISENAFRTLKMRVRQANVPTMILMEGNPPNEEHWLKRYTNPKSQDYDKDIEMWEVSTYENWENLPTSYKNSLESMPLSWRNKYLYGHFGFMPDGQPFYEGFKEPIHSGEFDWNSQRELILGWDFGFRHPACLVTQFDTYDRWLWLREFIGTDITIDKFADFVIAALNRYYPKASYRHFGDPACMQTNDKSEHTSWQILRQKNINVGVRQSTYRDRKEIMESKLSTLVNGKPLLMVDKRFCKVARDGFLGGYHFPKRKEGQIFSPKDEQPFRDGYYEHIMNAGEYIAVNLFSPLKEKEFYVEEDKPKSRDNI